MIRWLPPAHEGGRIILASGNAQMGAVFPPAGLPRDSKPWAWRLFSFGHFPALDGRAKDEATARKQLLAALAGRLAEARLIPINDSNSTPPGQAPAAPQSGPDGADQSRTEGA